MKQGGTVRGIRLSRVGAVLLAGALVGGVMVGGPAGAVVGSAAAEGSYRFVAKLQIGDPLQTGSHACSGALVAPRWVITSKACFGTNVQTGAPPAPTTVIVGRTNLSTSPGSVVSVDQIVPNPDRNVLLARLATPVNDIAPIRFETTAPRYGQVLRIAGYGRTASQWVPDQLQTAAFVVGTVTSTEADVTGQDPANASVCKGDAGGPAFRDLTTGPELVAVNGTSWQNGCLTETETRQGAGEVRVDDLADWIRGRVLEAAYTDGALYREPSGAVAVIVGGHPVAFQSMAELVATGYNASTATDVPAGQLSLLPAAPRNGTLVRTPDGGVSVIFGGTRTWFSSMDELNNSGYAGRPFIAVPQRYLDQLPATPRSGTLLMGEDGGVYVTVGAAKVWFGSWDEVNAAGYGGQPVTHVPSRYLYTLSNTVPDGSMISTNNGTIYTIAGGAKIWLASWNEIVACGYRDAPLVHLPDRFIDTLPTTPGDGVLVRSETGGIYVIAGGAKFWFGSQDEINQSGYNGVARIGVSQRYLNQLPNAPRDGTLLQGEDGAVFVTAGGAAFWFTSWDEINQAGYGGQHVTHVPRRAIDALGPPQDGTLVRAGDSPQVWRLSAGKRSAVTAGPNDTVTVIGPWTLNNIPIG